MESKEKWIENILSLSNGIMQVTPSDDLYTKINDKINAKKIVPMNTIWLVAASVIVLISLNLFLIMNQNYSLKNQTASFEKTLNQSNQLYN